MPLSHVPARGRDRARARARHLRHLGILAALLACGGDGGTAPVTDEAPTVVSVVPADGASGVAYDATITVTFSEPVNAAPSAFALSCDAAAIPFGTGGAPATAFTLVPDGPLPAGAGCRLDVDPDGITDADQIDGPDAMTGGTISSEFTVRTLGIADDDWSADPSKRVVGNVTLDSDAAAAPFGVLDNDGELPTAAAISFAGFIDGATGTAGKTEHGGDVAVTATGDAPGRFVYAPAAGFEGVDRFHYVVTSGAHTDTAVVTLAVGGMIWFVDHDGPACETRASGCGRQATPYSSLAALAAENDGSGNNPAAGDAVFLAQSAVAYEGPLTLLAGQRLVGQDATTPLATLAGVTVPSGSSLPAMLPSDATTTTIGGTAGIVLGADNVMGGLTLAPGGGDAVVGVGFGTLDVVDLAVRSGGRALALTDGTLRGDFAAVVSTGGTGAGVLLANVATEGVVTLGTGADELSGAAGLEIVAGSGSFLYPGSISTPGRAVSVRDRTGGSVVASGAINPAGPGGGVSVTDNIAGTVELTGPVKRLAPATGAGLEMRRNGSAATVRVTGGGLEVVTDGAVGVIALEEGGTLEITGDGNTVSSTGAAALDVNVTIGAQGLTFERLSASDAQFGVRLGNTGALGGVTVTGAGTAGSGGTIARTTMQGWIQTSIAAPVSISWMDFTDNAGDGVHALTSTDLTIRRSRFTNTGTSGTGSGIVLGDVTGTVKIDTTEVRASYQDGVRVENTSGALALLVRGSTIDSTVAPSGRYAMYVAPSGTGRIDVTISGSTLQAAGGLVRYSSTTSADGRVSLTGNGFRRAFTHVTIEADRSAPGNLTYDVAGNSFETSSNIIVAILRWSGAGALEGYVRNNVFGVAGVPSSCATNGTAIVARHSGTGRYASVVAGNEFHGCDGGAFSHSLNNISGIRSDITIRNNTIVGPSQHGIEFNYYAGTVPPDRTMCLDIAENGVSGATTPVLLRPEALGLLLPGYAGASTGGATANADVDSYLRARNTLDAAANTVDLVSGATIASTTACGQPGF